MSSNLPTQTYRENYVHFSVFSIKYKYIRFQNTYSCRRVTVFVTLISLTPSNQFVVHTWIILQYYTKCVVIHTILFLYPDSLNIFIILLFINPHIRCISMILYRSTILLGHFNFLYSYPAWLNYLRHVFCHWSFSCNVSFDISFYTLICIILISRKLNTFPCLSLFLHFINYRYLIFYYPLDPWYL